LSYPGLCNLTIPENTTLVTMDVTSLYTNIPHDGIAFTNCLPMVGGSLRVLRLLSPLKLVAMMQLKYYNPPPQIRILEKAF
jgi:hypothetical protein